MEKDKPRRSLAGLIAAITLGLVVAITAAGYDLYFKTEILEQGDPAVNAIQIENAKGFAEIYGNYSRFEFNHPGPAFFYVYAAGEWLLLDLLGLVPSPHNAHLLACMALQCLFLAIALSVLADLLRWSAWLPLAVVASAVHFPLAYGAFTSIWPPHVLLMPFLCFMTACTAVATGRLRFVPLMIGVGGVLFHGHVAQTLFVGGLGALAFALGAWHRHRDGHRLDPRTLWREHRSPALVSAGLIALFLLPLGIDLVQRGLESNVATIVRRFLVNTDDSKTLLQALLYVASFATYSQEQENVLATIGPETAQFFAAHAGVVTVWAFLIFAPAAAWPAVRRRLTPDQRRTLVSGYLVFGATLVLCVLWALAQAGPMHQFNGFFYYGVTFFGAALGLGLPALVLERRAPAAFGATLCAVAAVVLTWSVRPPRLTDNESGQVIRRGVAAAVQELPASRPVILSFEHHHWPEAAAVALELKRRGFPFYTVPTWNFMFGDPHDLTRLGPAPEEKADVWWIGEGTDGIAITSTIQIFKQPPLVSPQGSAWYFGRADVGFRHVVRGLSVGNVDRAWSEQPEVAFLLRPLPATNDVRLTFEAEANINEEGGPAVQTALVHLAGKAVGQVSVSHRAEVSVLIPKAQWNAQTGVTKLTLTFPQAVRKLSFSRPRAREYQAWGFWRIQFNETP